MAPVCTIDMGVSVGIWMPATLAPLNSAVKLGSSVLTMGLGKPEVR
jgi:hypothetical protein